MSQNINMEFLQALNPLYAVPVIVVILCVFIVYAVGFKSPGPPPSFDGIEEEKKYSKKRKGKDTQKVKIAQNAKLNGSSGVSKRDIAPSSKKKESTEKATVTDKHSSADKSVVPDKKISKSKLAHEKKLQDKKKDSIPDLDDFNEDGWIQLVSKKGKKIRKKGDSGGSKSCKLTDANKSDDNSPVEESPKKLGKLNNSSSKKDSLIENQLPLSKDQVAKDPSSELKYQNAEISKIGAGIVETIHSEEPVVKEPAGKEPQVSDVKESKKKKKKNLESILEVHSTSGNNSIPPPLQPLPDLITSGPILKDVKQKKKKNVEPVPPVSESKEIISNMPLHPLPDMITNVPFSQEVKSKKKKKKSSEVLPVSEASDIVPETLPVSIPGISTLIITNTSDSPQVMSGNLNEDKELEVKSSNVAFDELAGLYPETKEQKKKKKVRRDH